MWLLWTLAYVCEVIGWLSGTVLKLNLFNVKVLTMHRWFKIDKAEQELGYEPIISFADGWADTLSWFKQAWLPTFKVGGLVGLHAGTEAKIATQAAGTTRNKMD
jgi:hypothetical protein